MNETVLDEVILEVCHQALKTQDIVKIDEIRIPFLEHDGKGFFVDLRPEMRILVNLREREPTVVTSTSLLDLTGIPRPNYPTIKGCVDVMAVCMHAMKRDKRLLDSMSNISMRWSTFGCRADFHYDGSWWELIVN